MAKAKTKEESSAELPPGWERRDSNWFGRRVDPPHDVLPSLLLEVWESKSNLEQGAIKQWAFSLNGSCSKFVIRAATAHFAMRQAERLACGYLKTMTRVIEGSK